MIQLNSGWFGGRPTLASAQLREAVDMGFYGISLLPGEPCLKLDGIEMAKANTGARFGAAAYASLCPDDGDTLDKAVASLKALGSNLLILDSPMFNNKELQAAGEQLLLRFNDGAEMVGDEAVEEFGLSVAEYTSQEQELEAFIRKLHAACTNYPGLQIALRANPNPASLLNLEYFRHVLSELNGCSLGIWFCPHSAKIRAEIALEDYGQWLDFAPAKILGCSLQDYLQGQEHLLPGDGSLDFRPIAEYLPRDSHKVLAGAPAYPKQSLLEAKHLLDSIGIR